MRGELPLLAFGFSVVPALILGAEGALALAERGGRTDAESSGINYLHRYSEVYGWEPRPGRYVEAGRVITINAQGYRGAAVGPEPAPGRRRVVLLGDSVAFGLHVDDRETYAATVSASNSGFEVLNLAVQGYGPGQSLLRLERLGLSLNPNVVVLGFCLANDFADAMLPTFLFNDKHPKPFFTLEQDELVRHDAHMHLGLRTRTALWLRDHSRLYRFVVADSREPEGRREGRGGWLERRRLATRDREATLALVTRLVVTMRDLAASRGAPFLVLLHPDRPRLRAERWADEFAARLEAEGVSVVDLLKSYEARGLDFEDVATDALGHLSPPGHAATATILEAALREASAPPQHAAFMGTSFRPPR